MTTVGHMTRQPVALLQSELVITDN